MPRERRFALRNLLFYHDATFGYSTFYEAIKIHFTTVSSMAHTGSTIYHHDKRRYARVSFERSVKLLAHDATGKPFHAKNLSLGGMFLEGRVDMSVGQDCRIELHETGHRASMIYHICGRIVHADHEGVGIQFTGMEDHSLMYLQTMLLYSSDDPITAAEHFAEGFTSSVSSPC